MRERLLLAAIVTGLVAAGGCGGSDSDSKPHPARSPAEFAARFERISGVRLTLAQNGLGTGFDLPDQPDTFDRYGVYSLTWSNDDGERRVLLSGAPDSNGVHFSNEGGGWNLSKAFGPRLVLEQAGGKVRGTTPQWDRLERAVDAAYQGDTSLLPAPERPCGDVGLDPLEGDTGICSVDGIPARFVNSDDVLSTAILRARVLGFQTTDRIDRAGLDLPPLRPSGKFVVVAYRVTNTSSAQLNSVDAALRLGGRTFEQDVDATYAEPGATGTLDPGASAVRRSAFDVDSSVADQVGHGALILPGATDAAGSPTLDLQQGWIRLDGAPERLPAPQQTNPPPTPAPPGQLGPQPRGVPDIPFHAGTGPLIGGTARRLYTANVYFPLPNEYKPGGINVGSTAGDCRVPQPTPRDKSELQAAARHETPTGTIRPPRDSLPILLADCGEKGRWAMYAWFQKKDRPGLTINVDEFAYRDGRWIGTPTGTPPGCRLPDDAAAVWKIDISYCEQLPGTAPANPT